MSDPKKRSTGKLIKYIWIIWLCMNITEKKIITTKRAPLSEMAIRAFIRSSYRKRLTESQFDSEILQRDLQFKLKWSSFSLASRRFSQCHVELSKSVLTVVLNCYEKLIKKQYFANNFDRRYLEPQEKLWTHLVSLSESWKVIRKKITFFGISSRHSHNEINCRHTESVSPITLPIAIVQCTTCTSTNFVERI